MKRKEARSGEASAASLRAEDGVVKLGRPSIYTDELATEICERLSKGEPLAVICRDEHMPAVRTVSDWKKSHPGFSADFMRARDEGYDAIALECLEIADDKSGDAKLVGSEGDERLVCDTEFVQRAKLRIETRLKLLAKWDPRRYGDKVALTGGGPDDAPIQSELTVRLVRPKE